jgi:hypothetical protein
VVYPSKLALIWLFCAVAASHNARAEERPQAGSDLPPPPDASAPDPVSEPAADPLQTLPPPPPPRATAGSGSTGPTIQVETPPLPPPRARGGYRVHDGFYLRLGLGLGSGHAGISADSSSVPDHGLEGGSLVFEALVGGTPALGLAVGGALLVGSLGADRIRVDGNDAFVDVSGQYGVVGAFVDGFPNPTGGFHLGGALGLAGLRLGVADEGPVDDFDGGGLGLAAWVGYDAWISSEWSLGGMLQFVGVITRDKNDSIVEQGRAGGVSLAFVTLFH